MGRANDLGSAYPSDAADSMPDDPTDGRGEVDYNIPYADYEGSNPFAAAATATTVSDGAITEIDIRTTIIKDSLKRIQTTLDSFFDMSTDDASAVKLAMKTDAYLIGDAELLAGTEERMKAMGYKFDETDDVWRPDATFLKEETP